MGLIKTVIVRINFRYFTVELRVFCLTGMSKFLNHHISEYIAKGMLTGIIGRCNSQVIIDRIIYGINLS